VGYYSLMDYTISRLQRWRTAFNLCRHRHQCDWTGYARLFSQLTCPTCCFVFLRITVLAAVVVGIVGIPFKK